MTRIHQYILLIAFMPCLFFGQAVEVVPPDYIKTIIFIGETPESQLPIVKLLDKIALGFHALNRNEEDFYYKIEHYHYDWTPSNITKAEYMNGYDNQRIRNFETTFNTYQVYSPYNLITPIDSTRGL